MFFMYCNVLLVNQRGGESLGQLGEGLGRTGGWGTAHECDRVGGMTRHHYVTGEVVTVL
jgi:hypothetical protein